MIDGVLQNGELRGVEVIIDLIPLSNKKARPQHAMNPTSITIHETGNTARGAGAVAHSSYVNSVDNYVSWHFSVDDKFVIQELPVNENAWHAGDGGNGKGNRTSIAIEICVNSDGNFGKAKENAKKLVQYLMRETGIKEVVPHKHWSGKECPRNILAEGWDKFHSWLMEGDHTSEVEQLRAERDFWKQKVYDMLNLAESATLEGSKLYMK